MRKDSVLRMEIALLVHAQTLIEGSRSRLEKIDAPYNLLSQLNGAADALIEVLEELDQVIDDGCME